MTGTPPRSCYGCEQESEFDRLPLRERIAVDEHWRLAHAFDSALPGWLVLVTRRHVDSLADLRSEEAAALGGWQQRASAALKAVLGCERTYVVMFGEQPGFHLHLHVVPRPAELPPEQRGPGIFALLGRPPAERVARNEMDEIARQLSGYLGAA